MLIKAVIKWHPSGASELIKCLSFASPLFGMASSTVLIVKCTSPMSRSNTFLKRLGIRIMDKGVRFIGCLWVYAVAVSIFSTALVWVDRIDVGAGGTGFRA